MGFFDDSDDAPPVSMTEYSPVRADTEFPAVNMMQIFDDVTGEEFNFIKGRDGSRYLQISDEISKLEQERGQLSGNGKPWHYDVGADRNALDKRIADLRTEQSKAQSANQHNERHGLTSGEVRVGTRNRFNRVAIDIPEVNELQAIQLREASAVIDVTRRIRELSNTINTLESTDPMVISQNRGFIDSYRAASERAISRGFDAKYNGLEEKLKQMGMDKSSSGLGAYIGLAREETDAYVNNELKTYQLAHGLKQNTVDNMFKIGQQTVQEGSLEMQRFMNESKNELMGRQQDLALEDMKQRRAISQSSLRLQQQEQRNPMRLALPFISNNNQLALGGINSTNQANHNMQSNQLEKSRLDLEQFKLDQLSQNNPFGQLVGTAIGAGVGAMTGGLGSMGATALGGKLFGSEVVNQTLNRRGS